MRNLKLKITDQDPSTFPHLSVWNVQNTGKPKSPAPFLSRPVSICSVQVAADDLSDDLLDYEEEDDVPPEPAALTALADLEAAETACPVLVDADDLLDFEDEDARLDIPGKSEPAESILDTEEVEVEDDISPAPVAPTGPVYLEAAESTPADVVDGLLVYEEGVEMEADIPEEPAALTVAVVLGAAGSILADASNNPYDGGDKLEEEYDIQPEPAAPFAKYYSWPLCTTFKDLLMRPELTRAACENFGENLTEGMLYQAMERVFLGPGEKLSRRWSKLLSVAGSWRKEDSLFSCQVQARCIPLAMLGQDILCQTKSGMGKIAIFVLASLPQIPSPWEKPRVIVLCPTPELAYQITNEFDRCAKYLPCFKTVVIIGGVSTEITTRILRSERPQIIVETPWDMLAGLDTYFLSDVRHFIVKECEKMLETSKCAAVIVMMFRATFSKEVYPIRKKFMDQYWVGLDENQKDLTLIQLLDSLEFDQVCIFVNSLHRATALDTLLSKVNSTSICIHLGLRQEERYICLGLTGGLLQMTNSRYKSFKDGSKRIMAPLM
ncbi:hypothetical protein BDK51DRAFT_29098 [Blyttiomyces helicus]|uniref:Helicase ATP-binding domain-containing protein n=1 Tax=Blyttiomyces helicus TaxID=388810 RepID=A0A4P9VYI0_9FUNG|nr:hypothetical protein BDK51DRAFT_29098 [Blyttiomyces helicus]|eukprot:RKO84841.1 hypothetical protein BDK51DRAFT_29098 [Blyttiomyces helicus]